MNKDIKILVLSVSAWNSKVGYNTWPALLEGADPNNVANITLRSEIPDSNVCNNYFCISENRVIKSIFNRNIKTGKRVEPITVDNTNSADLKEHNNRYNKMKSHRNFTTLMVREFLWKLGKWKTKELKDFIKDFSPDVIIYSMDGYIHFNTICKFTKRYTNAKSIGFFCDDNFTYKQSNSFGLKLLRFFQRKSLKKLVKETDAFWAITKMTKEEADEVFDVNCTVLTKPLSQLPVFVEQSVCMPINLLYTGNLQIGRDLSLIKVVNALREINKENIKFSVDVYTKTFLSDEIKEQIECEYCTVNPPIPQEEVLNLQKQANILLFLEDVDGPDAQTARLSFSTKITDYLSSGKCILAVGCPDTAPMKYFLEEDSAIIATDHNSLVEKFNLILKDQGILNEYSKKACECGLRNHKKDDVLNTFWKSIEDVLE